jgi:hypothetical protein
MIIRKCLLGIFCCATIMTSMMCGSDNGTGNPISTIPPDTTTSLDLFTGKWWVEVAYDTTIKVKDTASQHTVTTKYAERHRRYTVASAGAGVNGGVDYVLSYVDTFVNLLGAVDSTKAGAVVLTERNGKVTMVQVSAYTLFADTSTYVPYELPFTTGTTWKTFSDSVDTTFNLFTIWFRSKLSISGTAISAPNMLRYDFADSLRPCFSIVEKDTSRGTLTLDSTVLGGLQAGYVIANHIGYSTQTQYFCPQLNVPVYTRTMKTSCDSTKAFLTTIADAQTYDTVKTTVHITAVFDPRWNPVDTLIN